MWFSPKVVQRLCLVASVLAQSVLAYDVAGPSVPVAETFDGYAGAAAPSGWVCVTSTTFLGPEHGTNAAGGWRSYGANGTTDRALGFLGNSSSTDAYFTATWTNATGTTVDEVTLSYRAERWRQGGRTSSLEVAWALGGQAFTNVPELGYVVNSTGAVAAMDGTDPTNMAACSVTISNVAWAAGQAIAFRWHYLGGPGSGSRQGLGVDDIAVTAGQGAPPVPMVRFAQTDIGAGENAGTVRVWIAGSAIQDATVQVAVAGGSATAGTDYTLAGTMVVLSAAAPSQSVLLVVSNDLIVEAAETVILHMAAVTGASADPSASTCVVTLADNDLPTVGFGLATTVITEGGAAVAIPLNVDFPVAATVQVASAGTALLGSDFTLSATQFVFTAAGSTGRVITVTPVNDAVGEGAEDMGLFLSLVSGVAPGLQPTCHVDVVDNDSLPNVQFQPTSLALEEGQTNVTVKVCLTSPQNVTVQVAGAGSDLAIVPTTVVFSVAGGTTQMIALTATSDGLVEGPERRSCSLVPGPQALAGSNSVLSLVLRDGDSLSLMAANITSGTGGAYEEAGQRILRGLLPDVVALQEFNVTGGTHRAFVDLNFGTGFSYYVETQAADNRPNGIVSRWPIIASGEWTDTVVPDRDFAWATIDLPGSKNLHVVSVHLYSSGSATDRRNEANAIVGQIQSNFPASDYIAVAGDFNTVTRTESALTSFGTILSDAHKPADQNGNRNTNANRDKPYDYVLPNAALNALHASVVVGGRTFAEGLVFDSTVWTSPPPPVLISDSATNGMQHMAVLKRFALPAEIPTNPPVLGITPIFHDFGDATTGVYVQATFTVFNSGGQTLTGNAAVAGTGFSMLGATNFTVAGGASTGLTVRFRPFLLQAYTGDVVFTSNGGRSTNELAGTGAALLFGYDLWATQIVDEAQRSLTADADGDGWANLLEYATGGADGTLDTMPLWIGLWTNNLPRPYVRRDTNAVDATLIVEAAAVPGSNWVGVATNVLGQWNAAAGIVESGSNPVVAVVAGAASTATNRCLRLRIIRP